MNPILRCHDFARDDMVKGDNCYLYDKSDKRYVDFESGIWCTALGHANPRINRKTTQQINRVIHLGHRFTSHLAEEAAASLLDTVGEEEGKCIFLGSRTEAVELAINAAKLIGHLAKLKDRSSGNKQARGRGLMASLEFTESGNGLIVESIATEMLKRGFIIGFNPDARLLRFLPP